MCRNEQLKVFLKNLVFALTVSNILTFLFLPRESRSKSWSTTFAMASFDGKYDNLHKLFHAFLRQLSPFVTFSQSKLHDLVFYL